MIQSYSDLSVKDYDRIRAILDSSDSNPVKDTHILSVLTGIDANEILLLPSTEVQSLLNQARFLLSPCEPIELQSFSFQGYTFHISHNLCYASYIDATTAKDTPSLLHAILIPDGHQYNDGYQVDFSSLDYLTASSVLSSFFASWRRSTVAILRSSARSLSRTFSKNSRNLARSLRDLATSLSSTRFPR